MQRLRYRISINVWWNSFDQIAVQFIVCRVRKRAHTEMNIVRTSIDFTPTPHSYRRYTFYEPFSPHFPKYLMRAVTCLFYGHAINKSLKLCLSWIRKTNLCLNSQREFKFFIQRIGLAIHPSAWLEKRVLGWERVDWSCLRDD